MSVSSSAGEFPAMKGNKKVNRKCTRDADKGNDYTTCPVSSLRANGLNLNQHDSVGLQWKLKRAQVSGDAFKMEITVISGL